MQIVKPRHAAVLIAKFFLPTLSLLSNMTIVLRDVAPLWLHLRPQRSKFGSGMGAEMDVMMENVPGKEVHLHRIVQIFDLYTDPNLSRLAVSALGFEVSRALPAHEAKAWFATQEPASLLLFDLSEADESISATLNQASRYADMNGIPLVVSGTFGSVDIMVREATGSNVIWLCDPTPIERISAFATGLDDNQHQLNDISADVNPQQLRRLADEVSRIARALSSLSSTERSDGSITHAMMSDVQLSFRGEPALDVDPQLPAAEEIRKILRLRRLRENYFDSSLFADPAWDMLLDLLAARLEGAKVAVSSLCIAASVPPTTALRWIKALSDHHLFERRADPDDGRRIFIQLSDRAAMGMAHYFDAARKIGGMMI